MSKNNYEWALAALVYDKEAHGGQKWNPVINLHDKLKSVPYNVESGKYFQIIKKPIINS